MENKSSSVYLEVLATGGYSPEYFEDSSADTDQFCVGECV